MSGPSAAPRTWTVTTIYDACSVDGPVEPTESEYKQMNVILYYLIAGDKTIASKYTKYTKITNLYFSGYWGNLLEHTKNDEINKYIIFFQSILTQKVHYQPNIEK